MSDQDEIKKVHSQLTSAVSIALKKRAEMLKKVTPEEKEDILDFEKNYKALANAGNIVEANALHAKMVAKHSK